MIRTKSIFDFPGIDFSDINFNLEGNETQKSEDCLKNPEVELSEEIKSFRKKNKEFQATNDHETYLIVCFSCKDDKKEFLKNVGLEKSHTLIDGYEMAKNINLKPDRPSFKLSEPLDK